jgi:hypothetical protein
VQPYTGKLQILPSTPDNPCCLPLVLQQLGRIHAAAFSDAVLHSELLGKALFWQQPNFFGLDMTHLHQPALEGYFTQVCGREFAEDLEARGTHPLVARTPCGVWNSTHHV